jgi:phosphopantetheinyl transferase
MYQDPVIDLSMASYYIGLSLVSNKESKTRIPCTSRSTRNLLSSEGRRILSEFEGEALETEDIAKEENGRPFFPGRETDFSISHSGCLVAVSLVRGENLRTGCDVELVRPRPRMGELAEAFFSPAERAYIGSPDDRQSKETRFFQIWTLKECFIKLRGLSIFDITQVPSFVRRQSFVRGKDREHFFYYDYAEPVSSRLSFTLFELAGPGERYILSTVVEGPGEFQPEIRWFSQSVLACRSIAEIKAALSPAETVSPKI